MTTYAQIENTVTAYNENFGDETATGTTGNSLGDRIRGIRAVMPRNGTATSITARVNVTDTAKDMMAAIYLSSDNSLVAQTAEQSIASTGVQQAVFTFSSPPTLSEGVTYIIAVWSEAGAGLETIIRTATSGGDSISDVETYDSTFPATLVPVDAAVQNQIFCTYEATTTKYNDYTKALVIKRINKTNSSSTFTVNYDNFDGFYSSTFAVGDEIIMYADKDTNPATTKIFTGLLKTVNYSGKPNTESIVLKGVGWGEGKLNEFLVEPIVFNNQEISTIVTSLISQFSTGITVVNVDVTPTTLTYIQFKNISVWDAINQLAELAGFYFYVDEDKDLHFEEKETTSSGFTFDSNNITNTATFKNKRDGMANDIFVYGGNKFTGRQETFTADGAGSVYQVQKRPYNTEITVSGALKKGAVFEMVTIPISGQEYLVDFDQRNIILTSGTQVGNNIAGSLVEVVVKYNASSPIIKRGQNESSIAQYGQITKVITDKSIDDPRIATDIVQNQLSLHSTPKIEGTVTVENIVVITPGNTCIVDLPNQNISNQTYTILEVKYDFTPKKMFEDNVLTVRLNEKAKDILDTWKEIILNIKRLQIADINDSDVLIRLQTATGSFGFRVNTWTVNTFDVGSRFLLSHPVLGRLGTVTGTQPYLSGSFAKTYTFNQSGGQA